MTKLAGHNLAALGAMLPGHNLVGNLRVSVTGTEVDERVWIGNHASYGLVMSDASTITSRKWGSTIGGSEFGIGTSPTDFTSVGDGGMLYFEATSSSGTASGAIGVRFAKATATNLVPAPGWTVDDDTISLNFVPQFTLNGNTPTYVIVDLPTGGVDDGDGTASGTPTEDGESGTTVCIMTDQHGRVTTSTMNGTWTTAYRDAMVGGADLDLSFPVNVAITPVDLLQNWTLNGNTPTTIVSITPALPAGLSAAIVGDEVRLTGTPTSVTPDDQYTLTVEDEYERETSDTFDLQITSAAPGDWALNGDWATNGDWSGVV